MLRAGPNGMGRERTMSLNRADRDLVGLSVLALLLSGPKHTYEMHRMMITTRKDFVTGLPRSMYHAVERLLRDGHLIPVETSRTGSRPERTVYAVTDRGRDEVQGRLERLLATPEADSTLLSAALSFIICLPPARAGAALRTRLEALCARIGDLESDLAAASAQLPRILLLEVEQELAALRSQRIWLEGVLNDITNGHLDWPADLSQLTENMEGRDAESD